MSIKIRVLFYFCFFLVAIQFLLLKRETEEYDKIKKFAIISCDADDIENKYYAFYLPITAQSWRLVGYEPIVFIVSLNSTFLNEKAILAFKYLNKLNITTIHVKSEAEFQKITAMVSRLLIGLIDETIIGANDFVITSDSDLIPIRKAYYNRFQSEYINLWNPLCCGKFDYNGKKLQMYPMGHIGMKKKLWKDLFNVNEKSESLDSKAVFKLVRKYYNETFIKKNTAISKGDSTWYIDQSIFAVAVNQYVEVEKKAQINLIPMLGKRLDRTSSFEYQITVHHYLDFHAFQGDLNTKWPEIKLFMKQLFSKEMYDFFDKYLNEFLFNIS